MELYGLDRIMKNRNTLTVVNVLMGLLLLSAALLLVRDLLSLTLSAKGQSPTMEGKVQDHSGHRLQDFSAIMNNNPFGFPAGELKPLGGPAGPSISQTDLSLIGTISGLGDRSYAIFSDKAGKQDLFRVGEDVFGLGKLVKVGKDSVVIMSKGRRVELPFADMAVVNEVAPSGPSPASFARREGDSSYLIDRRRVQQALERPDQLMTDARFIPHFVGGRQEGFVIREVKPGGIYQSLGLRNGDVVLRINEFTISSPDTALQAITSLKGIDRAQLDIIRNGAKMTMNYQIR
jgi:general secretion pathway protein C